MNPFGLVTVDSIIYDAVCDLRPCVGWPKEQQITTLCQHPEFCTGKSWNQKWQISSQTDWLKMSLLLHILIYPIDPQITEMRPSSLNASWLSGLAWLFEVWFKCGVERKSGRILGCCLASCKLSQQNLGLVVERLYSTVFSWIYHTFKALEVKVSYTALNDIAASCWNISGVSRSHHSGCFLRIYFIWYSTIYKNSFSEWITVINFLSVVSWSEMLWTVVVEGLHTDALDVMLKKSVGLPL